MTDNFSNRNFGDIEHAEEPDYEGEGRMMTALGSVSLGMGGSMTFANYVHTGGLHGAEGPVALMVGGAAILILEAWSHQKANGSPLAAVQEQLVRNRYI
jgi:hypothetical protein